MRIPSECCQIHQTLRQLMPHLSETQTKEFVLWELGTITAQSGCRNKAAANLSHLAGFETARQRLREWLYDGSDI